jgi:hypothetical protein
VFILNPENAKRLQRLNKGPICKKSFSKLYEIGECKYTRRRQIRNWWRHSSRNRIPTMDQAFPRVELSIKIAQDKERHPHSRSYIQQLDVFRRYPARGSSSISTDLGLDTICLGVNPIEIGSTSQLLRSKGRSLQGSGQGYRERCSSGDCIRQDAPVISGSQ